MKCIIILWYDDDDVGCRICLLVFTWRVKTQGTATERLRKATSARLNTKEKSGWAMPTDKLANQSWDGQLPRFQDVEVPEHAIFTRSCASDINLPPFYSKVLCFVYQDFN